MYGDQFGEFSVLFSLLAVLIPYTQTPKNGSLGHKSDTFRQVGFTECLLQQIKAP